MNTAPRISVSELGKVFPLRRRKQVKGISTDGVMALGYLARQIIFGRSNDVPDPSSGDFLVALDRLNFDVFPGEVVGIIGRNGAGKSTLLKLLARVLDPTSGQATIRGRVVSLLDLGIGFAPDLTVRENIQIYGHLAGIPAVEIDRSEDRILELAGLVPYREVPLQSCPSGSFVQLAFSVMINLKADIILADEVLTVGDAQFRHVGEERIRSVTRTGECVLFVSHDMNAIRRCCTRVIWLDRGRIRRSGPTNDVVDAYLAELLAGQLSGHSEKSDAAGCRILDVRLLDADREQIGALQMTEPAFIDCLLRIERPELIATPHVSLFQDKNLVFRTFTPHPARASEPTTFRAGVLIPANFLNEGSYQVRCRLYVRDRVDATAEQVLVGEESLEISVMNPRPQDSVWSDWAWLRGGALAPRLQWTCEAMDTER